MKKAIIILAIILFTAPAMAETCGNDLRIMVLRWQIWGQQIEIDKLKQQIKELQSNPEPTAYPPYMTSPDIDIPDASMDAQGKPIKGVK